MNRRHALVIASFPAPYRVAVFHEMRKEYDLDVFFSEGNNENRNTRWFPAAKEFKYDILDNAAAKKRFWKAIRHIKEYDFVMPYDAGEKASIIAIVLCRLLKIPYYVNADGAILRKNFIRDRVKHFLYSGATACFSSGTAADNYFIYYGVKRERLYRHLFTSLYKEDILQAPVQEKEKAEIKKKLGLPQTKIVLSVGRFIPVKGYINLINAWKHINNATLVIIGGGEEKDAYMREIYRLGLKNILLYDFKSKEELKKYYYAADIFVLSTLGDVWGLVINEAMACGLPVVTTYECVAGSELICDGENGYLVHATDTIAMAEKIQILVENRALCEKCGRNNIKKIENATLDKIAERHIETIENTLGRT